MKKRAILLIIISFLISACNGVRKIGSDPYLKLNIKKYYTEIGVSQGQSSSFRLLHIVKVTDDESIKAATQDAIDKLGGDAIINVTWWSEYKNYIVGRVEIIHVQGQVVKYL